MKVPLIIMAKPPELGKVKTRLAQTIGEEHALEVYRGLLNHTLAVAKKSNLQCAVHWASSAEALPAPSFEYHFQEGDDLGTRMQAAFDKHDEDARVMIGTDCPGINPDILDAAVEALRHHEVVFGPAHDGGYYLVGIKGQKSALFKEISWSTDKVLEESIEHCRNQGWSYHLLKPLRDIDTFADLLAEGFMPELAAKHVMKS